MAAAAATGALSAVLAAPASAEPDFAVTPDPPEVNRPATFRFVDDHPAQNVGWDFENDGRFDATGNQVQHTFRRVGTFNVRVQACDGPLNGEFCSARVKPVRVLDPLPAGCQRRIRLFDLLELRADTICREGSRWILRGPIEANGFQLVAAPGSGGNPRVVVDTARRTIRSTSPYRLQSTVELIGPVIWWTGDIDWELPGAGGSRARSSQSRGRNTLIARVRIGDGISAEAPELRQRYANRGVLAGLPFRGTLDLYLTPDFEAVFDANATIPGLGGLTAQTRLKTNVVARQIRLAELRLNLSHARLFGIGLQDAFLAFRYPNIWGGGAQIVLPGPFTPTIGGSVEFETNPFGLRQASLAARGLNVPLGPVVLRDIGASIRVKPVFEFGGELGGRVVGLVDVNTRFNYRAAEGLRPWEFQLDGRGGIAGFPLAALRAKVIGTDPITVDASAGINADFGVAGAEARVSGYFAPAGWEIEGNGSVYVRLLFGVRTDLAGARVLLSNVGIGGCARLLGGEAGFSARWGAAPRPFFGCDLDELRVQRATASQAGDVQTIRMRRNAGLTVLAVRGQDAPPRVTLTGPRGERITSRTAPGGDVSPEQAGTTREITTPPRYLVVPNEANKTTYVALGRPSPGRWRMAVEDGSSRVVGLRQAYRLPEPRVRARVTGRGRVRTLRYALRPIRGQRVMFVEDGRDVTRTLRTVRRRRGKFRFRVADGRRGRRRIRAVVLQRGFAREKLTVASFRAPAARRPGRIRRVRVRRRGRRVIVTWTAARGASRYEARVRVSDGRRLLLETSRRRRRITVRGIFRDERVRVSVRGLAGVSRRAGRAKTGATRRVRRRAR